MSALPPKADIRNGPRYARRNNSGSLAIFTAIRRASSLVSSLAAMSALPPKADIAERDRLVRFVPKADILHCSNDAGLLGQVLPNFRQQFSFDTYFFAPASGKIHIATIMKVAVASTKFPNSGRTGEPLQ